MYPILKKRYLNEAKTTIEMVVEAPLVAKKCLAGQFIIFRIDEFGERIPLTIADYDRKKGTVTVMFQPARRLHKEACRAFRGRYDSRFCRSSWQAVRGRRIFPRRRSGRRRRLRHRLSGRQGSA